jgi:hypothetical protein
MPRRALDEAMVEADDQIKQAEEVAMNVSGDSKVWTIEVVIDEHADFTVAKALIRVNDQELGGWGRARRAPRDPDRPRIGDELAAARALSDLSRQLVHAAEAEIESFAGHRVTVQF